MTEKQVYKELRSVIGDVDSWVEFYLNDVSVGAIKLEDKYGRTKSEILEEFEVSKIGDKQFNIWWNNRYGWCCITFDYCRRNSY